MSTALTTVSSTNKMSNCVAYDDILVRHRWHVRAACGARAEDDGELRDCRGRHARLVEEDAAEVLSVGEDLIRAGV